MLNWLDIQVQEARREDWLRAAEKQRLIQEARAGHPRPPRLYGPLLAGLGRQLAAWGDSLQARYGMAAEPGANVSQN